MITQISYRNFKCFGSEVNLPTAKINLLTGINGRGKSTALHGLLLMRQSPEHSRTTDKIVFNGSCVELGSFDDVRNSDVSRKESVQLAFEFGSSDDIVRAVYSLKENPSDDMVAQIERVDITGRLHGQSFNMEVFPEGPRGFLLFDSERHEDLLWNNLLFGGFENEGQPFEFISQNVDFTRTHYVSADRIGPRDFYPKQSFAEFPNVGRRGEFTANILSKKGQDSVNELLCLSSSATTTVLDQTEAWLHRIFDGGKIKVRATEANIVILEMNSEESSKTYKPANVGFGYSYALPIIVSGLIARPGEVLIVENPEAHLHPYAQSQISHFLARVSTAGVQVFTESHSDHILNGLRIAVLDKQIATTDLSVLYFDRDPKARITPVPIESDGSIREWPEGFFDQASADLSKLFGV